MVERAFNMLLRKGGFGPPEMIPESLQGTELQFRFASPVERAKSQIEEAYVSQTMDKILSIGQIRPEIMERFDFDQLGKYMAKSNDFPNELVKSDAVVQEEAAARAQQAQQEKQMASMKEMAPMIQQAAAAGGAPGGPGGPAPGAEPDQPGMAAEDFEQLLSAVGGA